MVYRGTVKQGIVIFEQENDLLDGTEVTVRPVKKRTSDPSKPMQAVKVREGLMKFAGKAKGLPEDASVNLDHYLYGHPKQ